MSYCVFNQFVELELIQSANSSCHLSQLISGRLL